MNRYDKALGKKNPPPGPDRQMGLWACPGLVQKFEEMARYVGSEGFKAMSERDAIVAFHHGLGTHIRNEWGLWDESTEMHKWFKSIGIWHADDMSSIILTSFHRWLNGVPIDLDGQVRHHIEYWQVNNPKEITVSEDVHHQ